jgi:hypothetical protein
MRITRVLVLAATVGVAATVWDFVSDQARTETKERAIPDAGREALNQPPKASFPSFRQNGAHSLPLRLAKWSKAHEPCSTAPRPIWRKADPISHGAPSNGSRHNGSPCRISYRSR